MKIEKPILPNGINPDKIIDQQKEIERIIDQIPEELSANQLVSKTLDSQNQIIRELLDTNKDLTKSVIGFLKAQPSQDPKDVNWSNIIDQYGSQILSFLQGQPQK